MVSHYTIRERIRKLEAVASHEDKLYRILEEYMDLFPVLNAYLFRYSPLGFVAEGVMAVDQSGLFHIREMRDDTRSSPIIYACIHERKAKYKTGVDFLKQTSSKYIITSKMNSIVVVPVCFGSVVVGYIASLELAEGAVIDEDMLASMTLYGHLAGRLLDSANSVESSQLLSKRELEVMSRISWGESAKEMANTMEISELTVNQYVKTAIKKLGVQNRTQAVAELLRQGSIS